MFSRYSNYDNQLSSFLLLLLLPLMLRFALSCSSSSFFQSICVCLVWCTNNWSTSTDERVANGKVKSYTNTGTKHNPIFTFTLEWTRLECIIMVLMRFVRHQQWANAATAEQRTLKLNFFSVHLSPLFIIMISAEIDTHTHSYTLMFWQKWRLKTLFEWDDWMVASMIRAYLRA